MAITTSLGKSLQQGLGKKRNRAGQIRRGRFYGIAENDDNEEPMARRKKDRTPYAGCVSKRWAAKRGKKIAVLANPPEWTIFGLDIGDDDLDDKALAYLAYMEQRAGDGESDNDADDES